MLQNPTAVIISYAAFKAQRFSSLARDGDLVVTGQDRRPVLSSTADAETRLPLPVHVSVAELRAEVIALRTADDANDFGQAKTGATDSRTATSEAIAMRVQCTIMVWRP
jgi:hypothetical protein